MPSYQYQAKQGPEKMVQGTIEAPSEGAAIEKISQMGFVPVSIRLSQEIKKNRLPVKTVFPSAFVLNRPRRSSSRLYLMSGHFARLLKAGVPALKAIHLLSSYEKDAGFAAALDSIEHNIRSGKTLAQAMEAHPQWFPRMYVAAVGAGEHSGGLEEVLLRLAAYFKKQDELGSKIRRAMVYPTVLILAGLASIFFIVTFLVPRLDGVFTSMGSNLPFITRIVLGFSSWMHRFWVVFIFVVSFGGYLTFWFIKRRLGKETLDRFKLNLFFFGDLVKKTEFSRFSRTLALCFANGLPFLRALAVSIPTVENAPIRASLEKCYRNVEKGGTFGKSLKDDMLFSDLAANLISIGEESGRVEEALAEVADLYDQETDEQLSYLTTLIEPLMILLIGSVIGFIVIAVLLPIMDMSSNF